MDSKDNFLKKLGSFIKSIDIDYLIGITNKGIVKRAEKDLEKLSNVVYEIKDEVIEFKFDDVVCSISSDVKNYRCTCPSRNICKHAVMGYVYLIDHSEELFQTEVKENEFVKLKELSVENIKKEIGEKNLNNIIKRIEFGINFEIKESSIIEVKFKDENIDVKLLDDIENSICSCKSKIFCSHKAEALILYKLQKKYLDLEQLKSFSIDTVKFDEEKIKKISYKIKMMIEDIFITGLSRAPVTTLDNLNNLAIICHNYELPNLEKNIRDIKEEFSLYFNKNAAFDKERLLNKLTSFYTKTIAIENIKEPKKLELIAGKFKSSYFEIPPVELHGFAAEGWKSNSGYAGTTYYFIHDESGEVYTYTNAIPIYYDNTFKRKAVSEAPWGLNCNISMLSNVSIKLTGGKINSQNRISSSSETKGLIISKSIFENLNAKKITYDNWKILLDDIFLNKKDENENYNLVFLHISKFGEPEFDKISQQLQIPIYDENNNLAKIVVEFSSNTKNMIRRLERLVKYKRSNYIFGRVYIDREIIKFYPISYYDKNGEVENITI